MANAAADSIAMVRKPNPAAVASRPQGRVTTVHAGRVYRMSVAMPLDGRMSWAPVTPGRYQPSGCYLVREEEQATLIDTGLPAHRASLVDQLAGILRRSEPMALFLTRGELECSGNSTAIQLGRTVKEMIVPQRRNPFESHGDLAPPTTPVRKISLNDKEALPLGPTSSLRGMVAAMRLLPTFWVYDPDTRTLFTSDLFGHGSMTSPDAAPLIVSDAEDDTTYETVRDYLLSRHHWLRRAETGPVRTWLARVFERLNIETIAPVHGCVLSGRSLVQRHYDWMQRAMAEAGK